MKKLFFTVFHNHHKPFSLAACPGKRVLDEVNKNCTDPRREGIPFLCKKGACRGCTIHVLDGHSLLVPPTPLEQRALQVGKTTISGGYRLACMAEFRKED